MANEIELTEEQELAVKEITEGAYREYALGGLAGTGKTTVIKAIQARFVELKIYAQMLAPTGKACQVMRSKGINAETIHSFFYDFKGLRRSEDGKTEKPDFDGKFELKELPHYVIIDEASMINEQMAFDIRSHRIPIVWIGDYGQLAPIGGDPRIMQNLDRELISIHRQAAGNPIISLAHSVRGGLDLSYLRGRRQADEDGNVCAVFGGADSPELVATKAISWQVKQIIVGRNKTRCSINEEYRKQIGFDGIIQKGEKVVCLKNNRSRGIFNGQVFTIYDIDEILQGSDLFPSDSDYASSIAIVSLQSEDGAVIDDIPLLMSQFGQVNMSLEQTQFAAYVEHETTLEGLTDSKLELFDYGYALTCHKSQGSEWESVLIVDEAFREVERWRYTAITRAKHRCYIAV